MEEMSPGPWMAASMVMPKNTIQWNLDLRKPDLRKNLDLRKIVAATDFR